MEGSMMERLKGERSTEMGSTSFPLGGGWKVLGILGSGLLGRLMLKAINK